MSQLRGVDRARSKEKLFPHSSNEKFINIYIYTYTCILYLVSSTYNTSFAQLETTRRCVL